MEAVDQPVEDAPSHSGRASAFDEDPETDEETGDMAAFAPAPVEETEEPEPVADFVPESSQNGRRLQLDAESEPLAENGPEPELETRSSFTAKVMERLPTSAASMGRSPSQAGPPVRAVVEEPFEALVEEPFETARSGGRTLCGTRV